MYSPRISSFGGSNGYFPVKHPVQIGKPCTISLQIQISERICADDLPDFLNTAPVGDQLIRGRNVNAKIARM